MLTLALGCGNEKENVSSSEENITHSPSEPAVESSTEAPDADPDGDGYTNAEEELAGTNPNFAASHPYESGGYNVGFCADGIPNNLGPTKEMVDGQYEWFGYQVGDGVENFILSDQYGQMVELHSFCGQHIMLVLAAYT